MSLYAALLAAGWVAIIAGIAANRDRITATGAALCLAALIVWVTL